MLEKSKPVSQVNQTITALFYGTSGTGKTTLSCTFPKPLLLVDFGEHGTDSIRDVPGVDHIFISEWSELQELYQDLRKDRKYKTVVIDALQGMQRISILEALAQSKKEADSQISKRDFGVASGFMSTMVVDLRDLSTGTSQKNIVFLAHDRIFGGGEDELDDGTLQPIVGPRVMPSVSSTVTGSVNIVGNTYIREYKTKKPGSLKTERASDYCLRLGPHGYYITKIRKPRGVALPSFISNPDYDKLLGIVKSGVTSTPTKRKMSK